MRNILVFLLHMLFPESCVICLSPGFAICDDCLDEIFSEHSERIRDEKFGSKFMRIYSANPYDDGLKDAVVAMKYPGYRNLCEPLGRAAAKKFSGLQVVKPVDYLVPVPLHLNSERDFNQSLDIAEAMGKFLGIKVLDAACWARNLPQRASLSMSERFEMPIDSFKILKDISGLRIALVDDVCTTGTTLLRLARACEDAGAEVVCAYTLCSASAYNSDRVN